MTSVIGNGRRRMGLSPLSRRLSEVAQAVSEEWTLLAENIPMWPELSLPSVNLISDDGHYDYAPSQGVDALRVALRDRAAAQGADIGIESVLVTNGAFDGLGLVARQLSGSGVRRAICGGPVLLSFADLLHAAGLEVVVEDWQELIAAQGWVSLGLGPGDLLYVNTPHNPTGACLDDSTARALLAARERQGFSVIFDLVCDSFVFDQAVIGTPLPLIRDWQGVYAINSFSKNYGAPGLRIGWIIAGQAAIEQLTIRLEWERISVGTAAQYHAAALCGHGNAALVERVRVGRQMILDWAAGNNIGVGAQQGGVQAWLNLADSGGSDCEDAEDFADKLMMKHKIVITTGANYYPRAATWFRIPAGVPEAVLRDVLPMLAASWPSRNTARRN